MTKTPVTDALLDHFQRTWAMLRDAVVAFPEDAWLDVKKPDRVPARIGYHILLSSERYTWQGSAGDYLPNRRYSLNWETVPLVDLPDKIQLLEHFNAMEVTTLNWLRSHGDAGLTAGKPTFPWTGSCILAQALYLLRHLQHHLAEFNVELRRIGLATADWK